MTESVYRVNEVIESAQSREAAARNGVETAAKTVQDLRVAEVLREDVTIENGGVTSFRIRLAISFKYESGEEAPNPQAEQGAPRRPAPHTPPHARAF